MMKRLDVELSLVRDAATRAGNKVVEFSGKLDEFTDNEIHYKTDFEWWTVHLTKLVKNVDEATTRMQQIEVSLALDNTSFKDWAADKITQIGRIFRR